MKFVCFYHSLVSDWNHGNAHFLRGYANELRSRGHEVKIYEPAGGWSVANLVADHGEAALAAYRTAYPDLVSERYEPELDLEVALDGADVVIVHEWTDPALVARIGRHRATTRRYVLLFHDTHHRSITAPHELRAYDLSEYDGVLAFGRVIRDIYLDRGWAARAWTWHEAADARVFTPHPTGDYDGDVVWVGNWGDDERATELREMLIEPISALRLHGRVHGVRYPAHARMALEAAGIEYAGWLPNVEVPAVFSRFRATIHVPRRPYAQALPGIPTIRMFEALACGIPLISAPWSDDEQLFEAGRDYLVARDGDHVQQLLSIVIQDRSFAAALAAHGRKTILAKHTCKHRVDELLAIVSCVRAPRCEVVS
jgi:spore maturation protein CgeB